MEEIMYCGYCQENVPYNEHACPQCRRPIRQASVRGKSQPPRKPRVSGFPYRTLTSLETKEAKTRHFGLPRLKAA